MTTSRPLIGRSGSDVAATGLLLAAAVAGVAGLYTLARTLWTQGAQLPVTLTEDVRPAALGPLPDGVRVTGMSETVELGVDTLSLGLRLLAAGGSAVFLLSVAAGAWLLAGVIRSIGRGRPFDRRNPGRLVGLGIAILIGGLLAPLLRDVASIAVLRATGLTDADSPFALAATLSFLPIMLAVLVLTVAEAFRRGAALTDEVDGLV